MTGSAEVSAMNQTFVSPLHGIDRIMPEMAAYGSEFAKTYANHAPMVLVALDRLGGSEARLYEFFEFYRDFFDHARPVGGGYLELRHHMQANKTGPVALGKAQCVGDAVLTSFGAIRMQQDVSDHDGLLETMSNLRQRACPRHGCIYSGDGR